MKLLVKLDQLRRLQATRATPCGPQVYKQNLTGVVCKFYWRAGHGLKFGISDTGGQHSDGRGRGISRRGHAAIIGHAGRRRILMRFVARVTTGNPKSCQQPQHHEGESDPSRCPQRVFGFAYFVHWHLLLTNDASLRSIAFKITLIKPERRRSETISFPSRRWPQRRRCKTYRQTGNFAFSS